MYKIYINNTTNGEITRIEAELILIATVKDDQTEARLMSVTQDCTRIYAAGAAVAIEGVIQNAEEDLPGLGEKIKECKEFCAAKEKEKQNEGVAGEAT